MQAEVCRPQHGSRLAAWGKAACAVESGAGWAGAEAAPAEVR